MSNDLVVLVVMIIFLVGGALLLNFQIKRTERKDRLEQAAKDYAEWIIVHALIRILTTSPLLENAPGSPHPLFAAPRR